MVRLLIVFPFWFGAGLIWGQITPSLDTIPPRVIGPSEEIIHFLPEAPVIGTTPNEALLKLESAHAVTSLSPSEICQVGTPALAPALEAITGVDLRSRGPLGVQSDLTIRGGTFEQVAVYVDGIRWSAPQTAHHLLNLPLEPILISGLEVVRGGTGAFAGVGAFTGGLHIGLAPDPLNSFAQVAFEVGAYGWRRAAMAAAWNTPKTMQRVSVSHSETDGYIENTDAMITRATWIGDWTGKADGRWKALVGMEEKAFGAQAFYSAGYPHQFESTGSAVAQLTWRRFARWNAFAGVYTRVHRDRFELYREGAAWYALTADGRYVRDAYEEHPADTAAAWYAGANRHRSLVAGATARTSRSHGRGQFTVGVDARLEGVRSNVLGLVRDSLAELPMGAERVNVDAFVSERWIAPSGRFRASATAGINANSQFGLRVLPALDAVYRFGGSRRGQVTRPWAAFGSVGRSVRHPSYTDLYYRGGASGRADLQPEIADQLEVGLRWGQQRLMHSQLESPRQMSSFGVEGAVWLRRGADLIDWVLVPGESEYQAANLTRTVHQGFELAGTYRVGPSTESVFRSVRVSYAAAEAALDSGAFVSSYVLDIVRSKADLLATFQLPQRVLFEVRATRQARNGNYMDVDFLVLDYEPFTCLGLGVSRWFHSGQIQAFLRVDNALDQTYVDFGNVLQPGRWWRAGITWKPLRETFESP